MAKVSEYMSSPVFVVRPEDSLAYARNLMLSREISRLVVVDSNTKPIGTITISDIISFISAREESTLDEVLVKEVMPKEVVTIEESKTVKAAAYLMLKHKIGGLPVIDEKGSLVGIITRTDIVRAFAERYQNMYKVREVSRKDVTTARRGHSLSYIVKLINTDPAGKVVIIDEQMRPIGVIAKRDIAFVKPEVAAKRGKETFRKYKVEAPTKSETTLTRIYVVPVAEELMTPSPITIGEDEDAAEGARKMLEKDIGCLPVVNQEGKLTGILTKLEILSAMALGK
ncbi:MAG: CBS domain-containing protein [Acidilobaceae archaeon]|nr:CBS domain-containing protein [Acidilobaceae archaeon]MCX8165722.1 CBS domain-containing protein [Acidilobaceae archaeon]MDW7974147.1 CBS domain-containing protein [Sulfolobales archaeon]